MRAARGPTAVLAAAVVAAGAGAGSGCGSGTPAAGRALTTPSASLSDPPPSSSGGERQAPPAGPPTDDLGLPPNVPLHPTQAARADDVVVIRRWMDALRAGHVARAASLFHLPSRFQNGTPVIWLTFAAERLRATKSFNCGGRLRQAGAAGAYVIVSLRLVHRPGARCGQWIGHTARAAIRVAYGAIVEFYRLPDDPHAVPTRQAPHPGRMSPDGPQS